MGDFKYQLSMYNLFDYTGVEKHLEKMAAKGWRFTSIGNFFWIYRRTEPAKLKYSVTYVPEASQFDPKPLEKQKDMEAYCEEAGWKKVDNWMQMQIFCSENPDAVPIETDEGLRLEAIHKSMKKNFVLSHVLLLFVLILNACTQYGIAKNNWIEFLSDSSRLWTCGICLWGFLLLLFDIGYYLNWYRKAKHAVKEGLNCPEPKLYRYLVCFSWLGLLVLILGLLSNNTAGKTVFTVGYLACFFAIIASTRNLQDKMKRRGFSKAGNVTLTIVASVVLTFVVFGGIGAVLNLFDVRFIVRSIEGDTIEINGKRWDIHYDTLPLPLYMEDFIDTENEIMDSSRWVITEEKSFLAEYGKYLSELFVREGNNIEVYSIRYQVITAKAEFLYDFLLESFYEREYRYAEEGEREKTEYRIAYETENGTMYRQYYDGLPMAHEWMVLTETKIVPMTIYFEDLTEEQMKCIVEKISK